MDNLTHTLFALTLARTSLRRAGAGTTPALVMASNAPDADIVSAFTSREGAYLSAHRGITHGPVGIMCLAVLTASLVFFWERRRGAAPGRAASFGALLGVSALGSVCHVMMDLPTSYGTRLLSPFSQMWFAFDWLPIIDVYLLIVLAAGVVAARLRPAHAARAASIVLILMAANYGSRAWAHHLAIQGAGGRTHSLALTSWPGDGRPSSRDDCRADEPQVGADLPSVAGIPCAIAALPTFESPFNWRIVRRFGTGYELQDVRLLDQTASSRVWLENQDNRSVERARDADVAQVFLRFSRFPAARVIQRAAGDITVRLMDMRFVTVMAPRAGGVDGRASAFAVTITMTRDGRFIEQRLGEH